MAGFAAFRAKNPQKVKRTFEYLIKSENPAGRGWPAPVDGVLPRSGVLRLLPLGLPAFGDRLEVALA
jgi:hypothetical protein